MKDPEEAIKVFRKAIKNCDPTNEGLILLGLGTAYFQASKPKEATDIFQQVLVRFPGTEVAEKARDNLGRMQQ